jgi:hypothetical protein
MAEAVGVARSAFELAQRIAVQWPLTTEQVAYVVSSSAGSEEIARRALSESAGDLWLAQVLARNYANRARPMDINVLPANGDRFTFSAPTHVATRALLAESDAILRRIVGRVAC